MDAPAETTTICPACGNVKDVAQPLGKCHPSSTNAEEYVQALVQAQDSVEQETEKKKRTKKS
tara:strand:- start:478 stop:663 length:186 start_codon:yes stop_codon:yes gene_type:complete